MRVWTEKSGVWRMCGVDAGLTGLVHNGQAGSHKKSNLCAEGQTWFSFLFINKYFH